MGVYLGTMSFTPHSQGFEIVLKPAIIVDHAQQGLATIVAKFKMRHVLPHRNTNQVWSLWYLNFTCMTESE
jgi:hypothetical protein